MNTQMIGKYQIQETIGRGGMGIVYRAVQVSLNRTVAMKTLPAEAQRYPEFIERLKKEAKILAQLQHPNIVYIFDIVRQKGEDFLVMEYIPGNTLANLIKVQPQQRVVPQKARMIVRDVASALSHAHRHHIIHRDIKPANIMITHDGVVKVTDFGVARLTSSVHMTRTGMITGTPHYMSPEQIRGEKDIDGRSDIYSLGIVFYEMLTGKTPFSGESEYDVMVKQVQEVPVRPTEAAGDSTSIEDEEIILKCIAKNRSERYQTADQLIRDLDAKPTNHQKPFVLSDPDWPDEEATRIVRPPHKPRQNRILGISVIVVLIAAAGIAYFLLRPETSKEVVEKIIEKPPVKEIMSEKTPLKKALPDKPAAKLSVPMTIAKQPVPELSQRLDNLPSLSLQERVRQNLRLKIRLSANNTNASESIAEIGDWLQSINIVRISQTGDYDLSFILSKMYSAFLVRFVSNVRTQPTDHAMETVLSFDNTQSMLNGIEAIVKREYCFKILRSLEHHANTHQKDQLDLAIQGGRLDRLQVGQKIDICLSTNRQCHGMLFGIDLEGIYLIPPQPGSLATKIDPARSTCVRNIEVAAATGTEMVFAIGSRQAETLDDLLTMDNHTKQALEWSYTNHAENNAVNFCERIYVKLTQNSAASWSAGTQFIRTQQ